MGVNGEIWNLPRLPYFVDPQKVTYKKMHLSPLAAFNPSVLNPRIFFSKQVYKMALLVPRSEGPHIGLGNF
jgi:hypothetical protein